MKNKTTDKYIKEARKKWGINWMGKRTVVLPIGLEQWLTKSLEEVRSEALKESSLRSFKEGREKIADEIPEYFIKWRKEVDEAYASKDRKTKVLLPFPIWLSDELKKE